MYDEAWAMDRFLIAKTCKLKKQMAAVEQNFNTNWNYLPQYCFALSSNIESWLFQFACSVLESLGEKGQFRRYAIERYVTKH